MTVIEKIKMLWHDSDETNMHAIEGSSGRFDLFLNNMLIGVLEYSDKMWKFKYSEEFKAQKQFEPLVNFPSVNQIYQSDQLWPFFVSRLPGATQLKQSNEDKEDILVLLKKYATHVIANPYILIYNGN